MNTPSRPLKKSIACLSALAVLVSTSVYAWTTDEVNKTVNLIGTHITSTGFVGFAEGIDSKCLNSVLYFDISTPLGRSFYNTFLTAKVTKQKVRIGYTPTTQGALCYVELAALQP